MKHFLLILFLFPIILFSANETKIIMKHQVVKKATLDTPLTLEANIENVLRVNYVILEYCTFTKQECFALEMGINNGVYSATIPARHMVEGGITYYIEVYDLQEKIIHKRGSKSVPFFVETQKGFQNEARQQRRVLNLKGSKWRFKKDSASFSGINAQVVSASKKEQTISDAPAIISVLDRHMIENISGTTLADILKYIPAIEVSLGPDGDYRVSIRGIRKDGNILVLVNGHRMNELYDARAIYRFPISLIDRVEVIRGPGSSLFGSNAVAGIINIFTIKDESHVTGALGYHNLLTGNGVYTYKKDKLKLSLALSYRKTDGANSDVEDDWASDSDSPKEWSLAVGDNVYTTEFWQRNLNVNFDLNYDRFFISTMTSWENRNSWIGYNYLATPDSDISALHNSIILGYRYKAKKFDLLVQAVETYHTHDRTIQETPDGYISPLSGNLFPDGKLLEETFSNFSSSLEVQGNYRPLKDLELIAGLSFEYQKMIDYNLKRNYKLNGEEVREKFGNYDTLSLAQKGKTRSLFATYLQGDYKWNFLGVVGGVRFDRYSDFGTSFNPRAGIILKPFGKIISFKLLYGEAFRAPTFKELYDQSNPTPTGTIGNEDLKPEELQSFEAGIELKFPFLLVRGNFFYNNNKDVIDVFDEEGSGSVAIYENIGSLESLGLEGELIISPIPSFNFFLNVSWFEMVFEWDETVYNGRYKNMWKTIQNIPSFRLNTGVSGKWNKFEGFLGLTYGSGTKNNQRQVLERLHPVEIDAYYAIDITFSYHYDSHLTLQFVAKNLGNDKYSDPDSSTNIDAFGANGMIQPGREIMGYMIYRF